MTGIPFIKSSLSPVCNRCGLASYELNKGLRDFVKASDDLMIPFSILSFTVGDESKKIGRQVSASKF